MSKFVNLIGLKFNRLTVIEKGEMTKYRDTNWLCNCECGKQITVRGGDLKSGNTQSCGCWNKNRLNQCKTKHGKTKTDIYQVWNNMKRRCIDINYKNYKRYGGRGITICNDWLEFENFYNDMGERPKGLTLDRIDNNKGYCKENCRWASRTQQARNRRTNRVITWQEKTMTLVEWSSYSGIAANTLQMRIDSYKWSLDRAFSTPIKVNHYVG